jgi:hypothetical protein
MCALSSAPSKLSAIRRKSFTVMAASQAAEFVRFDFRRSHASISSVQRGAFRPAVHSSLQDSGGRKPPPSRENHHRSAIPKRPDPRANRASH